MTETMARGTTDCRVTEAFADAVRRAQAEYLEMPSITRAEKIDFTDDGTILVRSRTEGGYMVTEVKLPAALAVSKDINLPRLMP